MEAVAGEDARGQLASGARLPDQLGAEAGRGDRHRGARGPAPGIVQLGEACVFEPLAVEPGVEALERAGAAGVGVGADGGFDQFTAHVASAVPTKSRSPRRPPGAGSRRRRPEDEEGSGTGGAVARS